MLLIELSTFILKSERGLIPIVLSIVVLIKFPVNFSIDDVLSTNLFVFNKSLKASKKGSNETVSSVCIHRNLHKTNSNYFLKIYFLFHSD